MAIPCLPFFAELLATFSTWWNRKFKVWQTIWVETAQLSVERIPCYWKITPVNVKICRGQCNDHIEVVALVPLRGPVREKLLSEPWLCNQYSGITAVRINLLRLLVDCDHLLQTLVHPKTVWV